LHLIERAGREAAEGTSQRQSAAEMRVPAILGLMADEPDVIDE
jgi:hypothetical protein